MKKFRYLWILGLIVFDQLIKLLIRKNMYVGETFAVIDRIFSITYVQNRGAAFSLFTGRGVFLTVVPFAALLIAIRTEEHTSELQAPVPITYADHRL